MNRQEAASIVAYLNRAGLVGAMEGQAAVWADALTDVSYVTAQEVARQMAAARTSTQRWVTPGDIRDAVARIRKSRTSDIRTPEPPTTIDPDDVAAQIAWNRAYVTAIGDGLSPDVADLTACEALGVVRPTIEVAPRPVAALAATHKAGCACGCLTRPIRRGEGDQR